MAAGKKKISVRFFFCRVLSTAMVMIEWTLRGSVAAAGLTFAACAHAPSSRPVAGQSSFAIVDRLGAQIPKPGVSLEHEDKPFEMFVPAQPIEPLRHPIYPVAALHHVGGAPALVGVTIQIRADGTVGDIEPSLRSFSTPGPWASAFRAAVDAAVAQWRFVPAQSRHLEPVKLANGSTYWRAARDEPIETTLDVAFTFTSDGAVADDSTRE